VGEGTLRRHMNVKGYQRDTVYFSILDDEWPAVERQLEQRLRTGLSPLKMPSVAV
jgi:N-acetyltransferase